MLGRNNPNLRMFDSFTKVNVKYKTVLKVHVIVGVGKGACSMLLWVLVKGTGV